MKDAKIVWSDKDGDLRKNKNNEKTYDPVNESSLELKLRRLTSGKGRVVIEISALPANSNWCKAFTSKIKKSLGMGGAYKNGIIEIHAPTLERVSDFLDKLNIRWKKTGG